MLCDKCGSSSLRAFESVDPLSRLQILEEKIIEAQKYMAELVEEQARARRQVNARFAPIIHKLPPEVLSQVFMSSLQVSDIEDLDYDYVPPDITPLFFGTICGSWRDIAWSTPKLWNHISIRAVHHIIKQQEYLLEQWLSRSGQLPITVRLICSTSGTKSWEEEPPMGIFNILIRFSDRWKDVAFFLPTPCLQKLSTPKHTFPLLNTLSICPSGGQSNNEEEIGVFIIASHLRDVGLSSVFLRTVILPWENITTLRAKTVFVDECLEVLRLTPHLTSCIFSKIVHGNDGYALPIVPLVLCLETLYIGVEVRADESPLLDLITLPQLRSLTYDSDHDIRHENLLAFLRRSSCPLESLKLSSFAGNEDNLINLLSTTPKLRILHIYVHSTGIFTDRVVRMLSPSYNSPPDDPSQEYLLPQLNSLDYKGQMSFSNHLFEEMLSSRWHAAACDKRKLQDHSDRLQTLALTFDHEIPWDAWSGPKMQKLIADGFDFNMSALALTGAPSTPE